MKKRLPVGLIVEGNLTKSVVLRLPNIGEEFGPVKANTLRVARRASNFLQAGFGVAGYTDLQDSRLILLRVPDQSVRRIVDEICASELSLKNLSFALCESWLPSESLAALTTLGASVATIIQAPSQSHKWFVIEGTSQAVYHVRRLLDTGGAGVFQLRAGAKSLYFASEMLTTVAAGPLLSMAQSALRDAGLNGNHLHRILGDFLGKLFRDFTRSPRSFWRSPLSGCSPELMSLYIQDLTDRDPQIASVLAHHFERNTLSERNDPYS